LIIYAITNAKYTLDILFIAERCYA